MRRTFILGLVILASTAGLAANPVTRALRSRTCTGSYQGVKAEVFVTINLISGGPLSGVLAEINRNASVGRFKPAAFHLKAQTGYSGASEYLQDDDHLSLRIDSLEESHGVFPGTLTVGIWNSGKTIRVDCNTPH